MIWRSLLLSALLLALPFQAQAVVVFDAFGFSDDIGGPPNPSTYSITLGAGTKCVQVHVLLRSSEIVNVSSITIGGQALSLVPGSKGNTGHQIYGETWGGLTTLTGAQTVSVTWTGVVFIFTSGTISATGCDAITNGNVAVVGYPLLLSMISADGDLTATAFYSMAGTGAGVSDKTVKWVTTTSSTGGGDIGSGTTNPVHIWTTAGLQWQEAVVTGANFHAASGVPDNVAPTIPSNLIASAISTTSIIASWTPSTDNVAVVNYRFEQALFSGSCGAFTEIAQPSVISYTTTGLTPGTSYCIRVRAADNVPNLSAYSSTVIATTLSPRTAIINWDDNSPNSQNTVSETGFELWSCAGVGCSNFTPLVTVGQNVTQYTDTNSPAPVGGYKVTALPVGSGFSNIIYTIPSNPIAVLSVSPPSLVFSSNVGTDPSPQSLTISNGGGTGMNWTVSDDVSWLSISPSSGTDGAILTVSIDQTGLTSGTRFATITVTASGANGSPATIPVTFSLSPVTTPSTGSSGRIR